MKSRHYSVLSLLALLASCLHGQITATGHTFSVASYYANVLVGDHFHNSSQPSSNFPAGRAEVGRFGPEEVRALSEFNVSQASVDLDSAFLTFDVFLSGGQFRPGDPPFNLTFNNFPFSGTVAAYAYIGNGAEDISDYEIMPVASIGTFSTNDLNVGDTISLEITGPLHSALLNHEAIVGFRLQEQPLLKEDSGAWTFNHFRLTVQDETSRAVPEPFSFAWGGLLVLVFAVLHRRAAVRATPSIPPEN